MAFRFALEAVLKFRRSRERAERLKLEAIVAERARTQAALRELAEARSEWNRRFEEQLKTGAAGAELQWETLRQTNAKLARSRLEARLEDCERRREAQEQIFFGARREREVLDDLCLRQMRAYRMEEARQEQRELDELFLTRQRFSKAE